MGLFHPSRSLSHPTIGFRFFLVSVFPFSLTPLIPCPFLQFEPKCNEFSRRFAEHRLKIAEEEDDVAFIEKRLWSGQIEELIEQAEDELDTIVLMNEEVKPWEKPAEAHQAQFDSFATQGFGQHPDAFASRKPVPITPEEQAQVDEFWKSIDEEIKQDQEREAAERQARKAKKGQQ